ncbi:MAG: hypothetical protein GTN86_01115 [Xanthomonadales bacterium]|nr:hypothetical protein [Xanthomonadales bacterium]NIN58414.1 hypothetical protein [Xanthomonadales bacterium]NIN73751.1 hypothetical protein [Xanthomonadales bacterium]NIO14549.1 hypothetical protein [Xanthomonadales bacterium]NIP10807.1 hypothetical protein [Xanthomonadales bacterium]
MESPVEELERGLHAQADRRPAEHRGPEGGRAGHRAGHAREHPDLHRHDDDLEAGRRKVNSPSSGSATIMPSTIPISIASGDGHPSGTSSHVASEAPQPKQSAAA